jgi:serine/threonine protein kinase
MEEIKTSKESMVGFKKIPITDCYTIERKIGDGTYGCVFLASHIQTGLKRAIK